MREHRMESGEVLRFPDGTADDVVRRTAARRAGLDPAAFSPPTPPAEDPTPHVVQSAMLQTAQAQIALLNAVRELVGAAQENSKSIAALRGAVESVTAALGKTLDGTKAAVDAGAKQTREAISALSESLAAEKEIVVDERGRPVGVRTLAPTAAASETEH